MAKFKAAYIGEAEGDIEAFGTTFPEGKPADVDEKFRDKLEGNPFFKTGAAPKRDNGGSDEIGLKAEHHAGGKFNITKGEEVLAEGLSKKDADAFNDLTPEEQIAYVADLNK